MALPALLRVAAELGGVDLAIRGARAVWAKLPWSADKKKKVDLAADRFLTDAESLIQNIHDDEQAEKAINRLAESFATDLVNQGLTQDEAAEVRGTLMRQIEIRAIQPVRQYRALRQQLEDQGKEIKALKQVADNLQYQVPRAIQKAEWAFLGLGLAIGLAVAALAVSLR